jgi:Pyruvate/2-oxoacid:ferredoxin oxidoreductase gamma subunit
MAEGMGSPRSANMIMLGVFIKRTNLISLSSLIEGLENALKKKRILIDINSKALKAGYDLF